jgi:hypothetical protein
MTTVTIPTVIVGTGFRGPAAKIAIGQMRPGDEVELVRERNNPHDPLAVACHYRGLHVGYIPRQANRSIATALDEGRDVTCVVREPPVVVRNQIIRVEPKVTVSWEETS